MKPCLYNSLESIFMRNSNHEYYEHIHTKFYDEEKDINIITRFSCFEEDYGELYKCDSLCSTIPCMKSWEYGWWYNDTKNKCFRYWNYHYKEINTLIFLQNALWNCLQRKILKRDFEIYMLLIKKLPTELMYLISYYVGTDDNWRFYLENKRKLI